MVQAFFFCKQTWYGQQSGCRLVCFLPVTAMSQKYIDNLYKTKISEDEAEDIEKKKFIVNKNLGLIEKKTNSGSITKIYQTLAEAQYYQIKYQNVETTKNTSF